MTLDPQLLKGFFSQTEGRALFQLAQGVSRRGTIVEIGSYCGRSTVYLGQGAKEAGAYVITVDHHRGSEEQQPGEQYHDPELLDEPSGLIDTLPHLRRALTAAELTDVVFPVVGPSLIVGGLLRPQIDLLFIDGGHSAIAATNDLATWLPLVKPDGLVAMHDIYHREEDGGQAPRLAWQRALSDRWTVVDRIQSLEVAKRLCDV